MQTNQADSVHKSLCVLGSSALTHGENKYTIIAAFFSQQFLQFLKKMDMALHIY